MKLLIALLTVSPPWGASARSRTAPEPGMRPPEEIVERVQRRLPALEEAVAEANPKAVRKAAKRVIRAMGDWAGNPGRRSRYWREIDASRPSGERLRELWNRTERYLAVEGDWKLVPKIDPKKMQTGLRSICRPVLAYVTLARAQPARRVRHLRRARSGADALLSVQRKDGLFPFPDVRWRNRHLGGLVDRVVKRYPEVLVKGWVIDNKGEGDLQYDNAICGVAMAEVHGLTERPKYIASAKRAADWARARPYSTNWNYNGFRLWLLSRVYRATGQQEYLEDAIETFEVGVAPGQLEDGRWFDPHNARLVYQGILARGILEFIRALPQDHKLRPDAVDSARRALDSMAAVIRANGASTVTTTTEALSKGLMILGYNPDWETALRINVNAGLNALDSRKAPFPETYLSYYFRYRNLRSGRTPR